MFGQLVPDRTKYKHGGRNMLYPIGIQSFEKIRTGGFVYVDKTALIYRLAASGQYYFLSRPRRFGKSLLVSTMEAYFSGRKELFEGLAMESLEKEWTEYPVLHLDLTGSSYTEISQLKISLEQHLRKWESLYDVTPVSEDLSSRFKDVIDAAYRKTGQKVVILIDEYEKPIIDNIDNPELMEQFRRELQGFYSVIKGKDNAIRFAFLTGVTKLGKMSFSSGLNLDDISMNMNYSDICGISDAEVKQYFDSNVSELARFCEISKSDCYKKLKAMYGGYHFDNGSLMLYNPYSLFLAFGTNGIEQSCIEMPIRLSILVKSRQYDMENVSHSEISYLILNSCDTNFLSPLSLMYCYGYLTLAGYDPRFDTYLLDYPNDTVKAELFSLLNSPAASR